MRFRFFRKISHLLSSEELLRTPDFERRTQGVTRRLFCRFLLGLPLLCYFSFRPGDAEGNVLPLPRAGKGSIGEFFKGEELLYEIGFGLFKRVATGKLALRETEKKGRYIATVQAETVGLLGWVSRYRTDTYRSVMEEIDGGRRFRSLTFEEDVKIGGKLRRKTHLFDYQRGKWIQMKRNKRGSLEKSEEEIPPGMVYDDFLAASFNFRYGVYGEIERGRRYLVATFPRKGALHYEVRVAAKEEEEKKKKKEKLQDGKEYFVKLLLDPEVTHSKEGLIEGWLSKELYPIEGAIKDVILFGDVRGTLVKNSRG
jgi:hypothetical protein